MSPESSKAEHNRVKGLFQSKDNTTETKKQAEKYSQDGKKQPTQKGKVTIMHELKIFEHPKFGKIRVLEIDVDP